MAKIIQLTRMEDGASVGRWHWFIMDTVTHPPMGWDSRWMAIPAIYDTAKECADAATREYELIASGCGESGRVITDE